jgi:hypothetical protein
MNLLNFTHIASNDIASFTDMQAVVATCTMASGNTSVTYRSNTAPITVGMFVTGATINVGSVVTSVVNANTITISSAAANSSTNTSLTFYTPNKLLVSHVASPGMCKAWVNFNGTGTVAIRAAFNVSSITDNGTGQYTVNFTNAMPDANYAPQAAVQNRTTSQNTLIQFVGLSASAAPLANYENNNFTDIANIYVAVFR